MKKYFSWKILISLAVLILFALETVLLIRYMDQVSQREKMQARRSVPILMYHIVADYDDPTTPAYSVAIPVKNFEEQMKYLHDNGYRTITMPIYREFLNDNIPIPEKTVIISFDDGQHSIYDTVFPIIKRYNQRIEMYIVSDFAEHQTDGSYLPWSKLIEMQRSGLVAIGSHSKTHAKLGSLTKEQATVEAVESNRMIEEKMGIVVEDFAYPGGNYTDETVSILKDAGYKSAVTVKSGLANPSQGMLELHRLDINRKVTLDQFVIYVSQE